MSSMHERYESMPAWLRRSRPLVARPAGNQQEVRSGQVGERPVRHDRQRPRIGPDRPRLARDEVHTRSG